MVILIGLLLDLKSYFLQAVYKDDNTLIKALTFGGKKKLIKLGLVLTAAQCADRKAKILIRMKMKLMIINKIIINCIGMRNLNENWSTNIGLNYTKGQGYFEQYEDDTDEIPSDNGIVVGTDIKVSEDEDGNPINIPITDVIRRRWLDNDFYVANANANIQEPRD